LSATPSKILIIQTAFIGDVILAEPLARVLKAHVPKAVLHVLVIPETANALGHHPAIDEVIVYDKRRRERGVGAGIRLSKRLRGEGYDLALIPHRSLRSALLAYFAKIPRRIGFDTSAGRWLLTEKVAYRRNLHEIERNVALLEPLAIYAKGESPRLYPTVEDQATVDEFLQRHRVDDERPQVALAPGSVWATKRWPEDYYAALAERLTRSAEATVLLVGGSEDRALSERIAERVGNHVINAVGVFTLRQTAALLARCEVLVANDSAPLHLGVAAGTRVVAIFGSTVPRFGFYPYGDGHLVLERELPCRPCGIHGRRRCPLGTLACLREISPEEAYSRVASLLRVGRNTAVRG